MSEEQKRTFGGHFEPARAKLMIQAAQLIGLPVKIIPAGESHTNSEGRTFVVSKGYTGVLIEALNSEEARTFWESFDNLHRPKKEGTKEIF